jgi:signal transduction histidine kinase
MIRHLVLAAFALLAAGGGSDAVAAEPLTPIADIRALSREAAAQARPVRVRGVVTWQDQRERFTAQDDTGGVWVSVAEARRRQLWQGDDTIIAQVREGIEVEIEAVSDPGGFAPVLLPRTLRIVGEKPLPRPRPMEPASFFSGADNTLRIEVRGVVSGFEFVAGGCVLRMDAVPGAFTVEGTHAAVPDPTSLVDAEVRVRGVAAAGFNTRGEQTNVRVMVNLVDDVIVEKSAPASPFAAPLVPLDRLLAFRPEPATPHRVRTEGTVTFAAPGQFFFLQEGNRVVRVETRSEVALQSGDRVEAAGFVEMTRAVGVLGGAEVRKIGTRSVPPAVVISPEKVMALNAAASFSGLAPRPHDFDGHLIRFRARLLGGSTVPEGNPPWRRLTLEQGNLIFGALLFGTRTAALDALQPGSELEVTGFVQLEHAEVSRILQRFKPVRLDVLLRSPADVKIVRAPSWWTAQRLLGVIAVGVLALGGALLWVGQLRRQVRRKAQQLAIEMHARRDAAIDFQATMRERNRLAANLHDTLLQTMDGLGFQLDACDAKITALQESATAGASMQVARRMLDHAANELRSSVWALRSLPMQGLALPKMLASLADKAGAGHDARIEMRTEGDLSSVPDFVSGNLLLAAQEALHNALKHGRPRLVTIEARPATEQEGWIELSVRDDGAGFTLGAQAGPAQGHFGLVGMRERMERLGGTLRIESRPGRGTTLTFRAPLRAYDAELA